MESYQFEFALKVLGKGGAVLHPVAAVHINQIADLADFGPVNMAADDSSRSVLAPVLYHRLLVIIHVFDRGLGFQFDERSKGPVTKAQEAAHSIDPGVEVENLIVEGRADAVQEPVEVRQTVELVAVNNEISPAIRRDMAGALDQADAAKRDAKKIFQEFVMIADEKCDPGVFAIRPQKLLDEDVVIIRPIPFAAKLPAINEIADDI